MGTVATFALLLTWIAAEPALVRHYTTLQACEKALAEAVRDPGASGLCMPLPIAPTTIPDFGDGMRSLAIEYRHGGPAPR
jgi:hypothetical protein